MFQRFTRVMAVAAIAAPAMLFAQGFEYAPGTTQYRIASKTDAVQSMMGQSQDVETSSNQLLTVTLARASRDTMTLAAVLDSLTVVGPMGMTPPGIDKLVGMKVVAKLSPWGAFYSAQQPADSALPSAGQVVEGLSHFLPRLRGPIAAGARWTDTTSGKVNQGQFEIDRTVISSFAVVGDSTVAGEPSWKIARESNATLSGTGTPNGQAATFEGTSSGKAMLLVSRRGVFMGSSSEDQADIKVILAANGTEIGIKQTAVTTINKVN